AHPRETAESTCEPAAEATGTVADLQGFPGWRLHAALTRPTSTRVLFHLSAKACRRNDEGRLAAPLATESDVPALALGADRRVVELVQHVVYVAARVDPGREEVRELPVHVRRPE